MKNDKQKIASKKRGKRQVVDRIQQPIVGQEFEAQVENLAKQFKYVISGLIAIGGNMRRFTQVNEKDASFQGIVESFKTLGPQIASDFYDRNEYDKYFNEMDAKAKLDREQLIRSAFILGFSCTMEGFNSECTFEPPNTLHECPYGHGKRNLSDEIATWMGEEKLTHLIQEAIAYLSNPGVHPSDGASPAVSGATRCSRPK